MNALLEQQAILPGMQEDCDTAKMVFVAQEANKVIEDVRKAYSACEVLKWRLAKAIAAAEGVGGIAYDKDKVQGGSGRDMSDAVRRIMDLEQQLQDAEMMRDIQTMSFEYFLSRAVFMGLFTEEQASLWKQYYECDEMHTSFQKIADNSDAIRDKEDYLTRSKYSLRNRVEYLVRSKNAFRAFFDAVEVVMAEADDTDALQEQAEEFWEDYCNEMDALREQNDYVTCYSNTGMKI